MKISKSNLLSGACMLLAAGGLIVGALKDKADEAEAMDEMRDEIKKEVTKQLEEKE